MNTTHPTLTDEQCYNTRLRVAKYMHYHDILAQVPQALKEIDYYIMPTTYARQQNAERLRDTLAYIEKQRLAVLEEINELQSLLGPNHKVELYGEPY